MVESMSLREVKFEPQHPDVLIFPNYKDLCQHVARMLTERIALNELNNIALPTGNSSLQLYQEWVKSIHDNSLSLANLNTFNLDEYVHLSEKHPSSFHSFMNKNLFSKVDIKREHIHFPNPNEPEAYDALIQNKGGLDIAILGLGLNGHIAFNEPGSEKTSRTRRVTLTESTRAANKSSFPENEEVPFEAVTMGVATILEAKEVFLLCNNSKKWALMREILETGISHPTRPASYLLLHPNTTILYCLSS